jgi:DNA-binding NarL/FixJ family response regulator
MKKVYVVDLTKEEKTELLKLVGKGEARARKLNRAHILLLADEGRTDKDVAKALHTSPSTVSSERADAWWKAGWSTPSTSSRPVPGASAS